MSAEQIKITRLSPNGLETIFSYLPLRPLLQTYKTCMLFKNVINSSSLLAFQTLSEYYSTSYIDTLINQDLDLNDTVCSPDIIPLFDPMCFNTMVLFSNTNLFKLYSRLMSFNWKLQVIIVGQKQNYCIVNRGPFTENIKQLPVHQISNQLQLLHVHKNMHKFKHRSLNPIELLFFKVYNKKRLKKITQHSNKILINTLSKFKRMLADHFNFYKWYSILFKGHNFFLAGGSILKCLFRNYQETNRNKIQDLDFFAVNVTKTEFRKKIKKIKKVFRAQKYLVLHPRKGHIQELFVRFVKIPSVISYKENYTTHEMETIMEFEGHWIKFQFIWMGHQFEPWSVLQSFDLDCCQVGFDGKNVLSTHAFLQCITTKTIIDYKLTKYNYAALRSRTIKYRKRGFTLMVPSNFNRRNIGNQELRLLKMMQAKKDKIQWRLYSNAKVPAMFPLNNDSFGVRRQFIRYLKNMGSQKNMKLLQLYQAKMTRIETEQEDYDMFAELLIALVWDEDLDSDDVVFEY